MLERQEPKLVEVLAVRTAEEALVVAALLRQAGIPVHVGGSLLQDEFAVAQRALNLVAASIAVPGDRVAEARAVLAEARKVGRALAEAPEDDEPAAAG